MRCCRLLTVTLLVVVLSGSLRAQSLHGQWFKATATATGASITGSLEVSKAKFKKITHYIQLSIDEGIGSHIYGATIWVEDAEGNWSAYDTGSLVVADDEETFVSDGTLTFYVSESIVDDIDLAAGEGGLQGFDVDFNATLKVKVKNEEVKSAKLTSVGAVADGSFTGTDTFIGTAKVSMNRVSANKLPFELELMVKSPLADTLPKPAWRSQTVEAQPAVSSQH